MTIDYDLHLTASAGPRGLARQASDISDPFTLGGPGPYPGSGSTIVGTYVSAGFERLAPVPEPRTWITLILGLLTLATLSRRRARG